MVNKRGVKGLLVNLILPGLGTIFLENKKHGQIQLSLFLFPIVISILFGSFLNNIITKSPVIPILFALIMFSTWIWALTYSIKFLRTSKNETTMQNNLNVN